jgi:hypothetical protein
VFIIDFVQMGYFKTFNYNTIILQLEFGDGVTVADTSTFLKLAVDTMHQGTPELKKGKGEIGPIDWNAKTLPTTWKLEFNLDDINIKPLLTDGRISEKKLVNVQLIGLYSAKIY